MNILILANNAPNYYNFYLALANKVRESGSILFAVDSEFSLNYNKITQNNHQYVMFSQFSSENVNARNVRKSSIEILKIIEDRHGKWFLYPDSDRDDYYSIFPKEIRENKALLLPILVDFFVEIFDSNRIDFVVYENASNAFALVGREVAQYFSITYIGISISRLPGRIAITNVWENEGSIYEGKYLTYKSNETLIPEATRIEVESYLDNIDSIQPDYMTNNPLNDLSIAKKYMNIDKLKTTMFKFKYSFNVTPWDFQVGNPLYVSYRSFSRNLQRKIKSVFIKKYFKNFSPEYCGFKYFLYPLHFHPEASTSVLAKEYGDEYEIMRNIAYSLPPDTYLFVKDHMSAYAYPERRFYKKIKNLPNTILFSPSSPTKEMIKKSIGVITLTSTVGYEALLLNKTVITLGRVFYNMHDNCIFCDSLLKLQALMREVENIDNTESRGNNVAFLASYFENTFPVSIDYKNKSKEFQMSSAESVISILEKISNS